MQIRRIRKEPRFDVGEDENRGTELDEAEKQGETISVSSLRVIVSTDVTQRKRLCTRLFALHCARQTIDDAAKTVF